MMAITLTLFLGDIIAGAILAGVKMSDHQYLYIYYYIVGHKVGIKYFYHNLWDVSCTASYLGYLGFIPLQCWVDQSLPNIQPCIKSDNIDLLQTVSLAWNRKRATGNSSVEDFLPIFPLQSILKIIQFLVILCIEMFNWYCFKCHSVTKIKYGHPWQIYRASRGRRTLSTRLPMVSMDRASDSLVRAWANSYTYGVNGQSV